MNFISYEKLVFFCVKNLAKIKCIFHMTIIVENSTDLTHALSKL